MTQLLNLPQELILLIVEINPDRKITLALWSSCQLLRDILTPQAFSHLILDFRGHPDQVRSSIGYLEALADGKALACRYARTMEIWSLRNLYDKHLNLKTYNAPRNCAVMLEEALSRLEGVDTLGWLAGYGVITSIEEAALRGIKYLVNSQPNFTITIAVCQIDAPLVEELQRICPTNAILTEEWGMNVYYGRTKYYCARRSTSMLAFRLDGYVTGELFKGPFEVVNDITYWLPIANFKGLQTINITHEARTTPRNPVDISKSVFSQPTFWLALQDSGVQPLAFCVDFVTDPMLDYLASFSKLQYLCVSDSRPEGGVHSSEEMGAKFFKEVLKAHRETLLCLTVDVALYGVVIPGPWVLQHSNIEDLFVCQKLKMLAIPMVTPLDDASKDILHRALDLRKSLPHLHQLSILETSNDRIWAGGWSRVDISVKEFKGKVPSITTLGKRDDRYRVRYEMDGAEKVLRYEVV